MQCAEEYEEPPPSPWAVRPAILWEARERFAAAVESSSQLGGGHEPNRIVVVAPRTGARFQTETVGSPLAFLGEPPALLLQTQDGYVEWNFTTGAISKRADVVARKPVCFPGLSGSFIAEKGESADPIADQIGDEYDGGRATMVLADFRGHTHPLGDDLIMDPSMPLVACAVSSDGDRVAVADARVVALYGRTKADAFKRLGWFGAQVNTLAFGPEGRWLGADVPALSIGAEDSWFLVYDVARRFSHTYRISGVAAMARGRVMNRDLWNGVAFWAPGAAAKPSNANGQGSHPHALAVSPTGRFVATLAGNWGASSLDVARLR